MKWLDGIYVYEVNKGDGLYKESTLRLLSEYDGEIVEQEHIDIEYKFFIGDLVQVKGKGADLYKIVGFRTEIWRYKDDAWEDVLYELSRIDDEEWLEAGEEDLILLADSDNAEAFMQKLGLLYSINKQQQMKKQAEESVGLGKKDPASNQDPLRHEKQINRLLDIYNDYFFLFKWFGDEEYLQVMKAAIRELKRLTKKYD
ncbi:hypothetical protein [Bacillus benzoevorans]|uniref:YodN n=1 Tax=Bacillus benzoevorans TaxID=1456 RepID=A0A7X0HVS6_9BACI|nr:hypothetical protein [Bacillus benzoevorans]MBB6446540.1 hypothetical protein [Bacillus benzoevorans]